MDNWGGFIELSINAKYLQPCLTISVCCGQRARRALEMPIWNPAERGQEIFGPETIAVLAAALEDTLYQLGLVDRNDPAVTMVAKTIIELARQGERDRIRLRDQAVQLFR